MLDVKANFFLDCLDLHISPDPEVGGFLLDVDEDGLFDEVNLDSGFFLEVVDDEDGLLFDFFSLDFNSLLYFESDDGDLSIIPNFEILDNGVKFFVPFGLKFNNKGKIVSIDTIDFNNVVGFEVLDVSEVSSEESFFFNSDLFSVVDSDSLEFTLEFELEGKSNFGKHLLILLFNDKDHDLSFLGDLNSDFFNLDDRLLFNFGGLNNDPFGPVFLDVNEFEVVFLLNSSLNITKVSLPLKSEVFDLVFSLNLIDSR